MKSLKEELLSPWDIGWEEVKAQTKKEDRFNVENQTFDKTHNIFENNIKKYIDDSLDLS